MGTIGWVKLHRQIVDNSLWTAERFTRAQAWLDLILLANHKQNLLFIRGNEVKTQRGELCWSILSLAKRWQWNERTVDKYLKWLSKEGMIHYIKSPVTTIISVLKYDFYQGSTEQSTVQNTEQSAEQNTEALLNRVHTNKNVKKVKNEKNDKNKETKSPITETVKETPLSIFPLEVNSERKTPVLEKQVPAKIHELQTWVKENAQSVSKLKEPLTYEECERIIGKYPVEAVKGMLLQMHNWKPLTKTCVSTNLTLLKWFERDKSSNTQKTAEPKDSFFESLIPDKWKNSELFLNAWKGWIDYMKGRGDGITEPTAKLQLEKLSKSTDPLGLIKNAIEKSWKGFYEAKSGNYNQAPVRETRPIFDGED
jgi:hypothetical protein